MQLVVNGKKAVLKKGSSFEYHSENRAFSDADDYTLSITLPLRDCPENMDIFGHLNRMDFGPRRVALNAFIVDHAFSKNGVITVVEASDAEIKCQFLEGRSAQNFDTTLDNIYINELPLGWYPDNALPENPPYAGLNEQESCVALPWVNDAADGALNNGVDWSGQRYDYDAFTLSQGKLSYQPYLIYITEQVCKAIGFTCDLSQWHASPERFLLICNTLPASWDLPLFARALPHWSVEEFFSELEKILACEIDVDHRSRHISLTFCRDIGYSRGTVALDNVVDTFSSETSYSDDLCQFKGLANIQYSDRGDPKWQIEHCNWFVDQMKTDSKNFIEYETIDDFWADYYWVLLLEETKNQERIPAADNLFYIRADRRYKMFRVRETPRASLSGSTNYPYMYELIDVNLFGDEIISPDGNNTLELKCVPARIDDLGGNKGMCLFLSPSGYSETEELDNNAIRQPKAYSVFLKGEQEDVPEYYDKIYLAYWDGTSANDNIAIPNYKWPPCPMVDERFSLHSRRGDYLSGIKIIPTERMNVSWISDSIPDVRAKYLIHGKLYLCEKITATFSENGMSQLLKGVFYPIAN